MVVLPFRWVSLRWSKMRVGGFREHLVLVALLAVLSFLCFDEEPVFDFTDWNLLHVWLLVFCISVILFEPTLRSQSGQFVYKDLVSMVAALTFWLGLENYVRLVLVVFCLHNLFPLETDLLEQTEILLLYSNWLTSELLPAGFVLFLLVGLAHSLNSAVGLLQSRLVMLLCALVCIGLLIVGGVLGWDFVTAGLSSVVEWEQAEVLYSQPRTGWTAARALRVTDQFEWHRERSWPYSIRFEDLYFFFLQLLLFWDIFCCLCCWAYITASANSGRVRAVSYTQLGVGLLWLEHVAFAVLTSAVTLGVVTLRVWAHTPLEFGGSWL